MTAAYITDSSPHIQSPETVPAIMWRWVFALTIPLLGSLYGLHSHPLKVAGCAISAALLSEGLFARLHGRNPAWHDGNAVAVALLYTLLCPAGIPLWKAATGMFFGSLLAREVFGGTGHYIFHPALAGRALIELAFPEPGFIAFEAAFSWPVWLSVPQPALIGTASPAALLAAGLFLLSRKSSYWEIPVLVLVLGGGNVLLTAQVFPEMISLLLLIAFFLVTDPVTTPLTRRGMRFYALVAVVFYLLLLLFPFRAAYFLPFAFLLANGLVPWIDLTLRVPGRLKA